MPSELSKFGQSARTTKVVMQTEKKMTTIQSASLNSLSINFFEHPKEDISIKETFLFHFSTLNFISTLFLHYMHC